MINKEETSTYRVIYDHQIEHFNRSRNQNAESSIIFKDKSGYGTIAFDICAKNYRKTNPSSSGECVGERNSITKEPYFIFYTSGILTKIVFKRPFRFGIFGIFTLKGGRKARFILLQKMIENDTLYRTYDLS